MENFINHMDQGVTFREVSLVFLVIQLFTLNAIRLLKCAASLRRLIKFAINLMLIIAQYAVKL